MTLKSKLIPFVVLTTIPVACLPTTLTSCSGDKVLNKVVDLTQNYYSNFERYPLAKMSLHEAHDVYLNKLLENHEIFADDYFWSRSSIGSTFEPIYFWQLLLPEQIITPGVGQKEIIGPSRQTFVYDNQVISNLKVEKQDASINGINWSFPTLSFTLDISARIKDTVISQSYDEQFVSGYINGNVACKIQFTSVPFHLVLRTYSSASHPYTTEAISFEPFGEWLIKNPYDTPKTRPSYWRISISITSSISGELTYTTGLVERIADDFDFNAISNEENPNWYWLQDSLDFVHTFCWLFTTSHYLERITILK